MSAVGYYPGNCVPASTSSRDCSGRACGISLSKSHRPQQAYCRSDVDDCQSGRRLRQWRAL
ncbi:MAG: hypothetical protein R3B07_34315 [Polyangiaceae bacterium]